METEIERIDKQERVLWKRQERISLALSIGVPFLILILAAEAVAMLYFREKLLFQFLGRGSNMPIEAHSPSTTTIVLSAIFAVWVVTLITARAMFAFAFLRPVHVAQEKLEWVRRKVRFDKSCTDDRIEFLRGEVKRVTSRIVRAFSLISKDVDKKVLQRLEYASQILEQWPPDSSARFVKVSVITAAGTEEEKERDLTVVEEVLSAAEGVIYREEREQREQQLWRNTSTSVVALYFVLLGLLFSYNLPSASDKNGNGISNGEQPLVTSIVLQTSTNSEGNTQSGTTSTGNESGGQQNSTQENSAINSDDTAREPLAGASQQNLKPNELFGIPLSVVAWSALGSIAAILFRLYDMKKRVDFQAELRWLIARPLIGIIMGSLAYLTIVASVLVIGDASALGTATSTEGNVRQSAIFSIVAFLGGFSERFYMGIINALVERVDKGKETQATSAAKAHG